MFGYVQPAPDKLTAEEEQRYRALYCGLCKSIGGSCGQRARMGLSYDMTFLSAILHNMMHCDVKIEKKHCVLHPIVRRPIAADDEVTQAVACLNTLLVYYKLTDDVEDEGKGKATRAFFKKGYKRAKLRFPQLAEIVKNRMAELSALEKEGCDCIDRAADPFGSMIAEISDRLLGEYKSEDTHNLFYGIGKWVYLIDALDDYDKDVKKKNYNPFLRAFGQPSRAQMLEKNGEEVDFIFKSVFAQNAECLKKIRFYFNHDLTDNIVLRGLPAATRRVLCGCGDKGQRPEKIRLN